jgi:hypothetical protein
MARTVGFLDLRAVPAKISSDDISRYQAEGETKPFGRGQKSWGITSGLSALLKQAETRSRDTLSTQGWILIRLSAVIGVRVNRNS